MEEPSEDEKNSIDEALKEMQNQVCVVDINCSDKFYFFDS
jgi:hypothetical protein